MLQFHQWRRHVGGGAMHDLAECGAVNPRWWEGDGYERKIYICEDKIKISMAKKQHVVISPMEETSGRRNRA
jgi:hypothetical protein